MIIYMSKGFRNNLFGSLIALSVFLLLADKFSFSDYLSKTETVNANILIIEGWLPDYAIEMAVNEFQNKDYDYIITTGLLPPEYYNIFTGGYLIFYPQIRFAPINRNKHHIIEILAYSELGDDNRAHFNFFVNDSLVANFFVDKQKRKYKIEWNGMLAKIDSLIIQFDNDKVGYWGDRNLFVKEIIIDNKLLIPYYNNTEYDILELDGKDRIINNYGSYAELARNKLLNMGIDSSFVIAVPGKETAINRTLATTLAVHDWFKSSNCEVKGINIVSLGNHARRTWMIYNKVFHKSYNIGIMSLPDLKNRNTFWKRTLNTVRETFGFIYYWLILIGY